MCILRWRFLSHTRPVERWTYQEATEACEVIYILLVVFRWGRGLILVAISCVEEFFPDTTYAHFLYSFHMGIYRLSEKIGKKLLPYMVLNSGPHVCKEHTAQHKPLGRAISKLSSLCGFLSSSNVLDMYM